MLVWRVLQAQLAEDPRHVRLDRPFRHEQAVGDGAVLRARGLKVSPSTVVMARHGFGRGEYRYFAYPLPDPVQTLRTSLYPQLSPIANAWHARMGQGTAAAAGPRRDAP